MLVERGAVDAERVLHDRGGIHLFDEARAARQRLLAADDLLDVIDVQLERVELVEDVALFPLEVCVDSADR